MPVGVLISGGGTNLQEFIDQIEAGKINAKIECVISNKEDVFGLERARKHGIPAFCIGHKGNISREQYDELVVRVLELHGVKLVLLAGFMRLVSPVLLNAFPNAVMNLHPALAPAFPGAHAVHDALRYGVKITGCTVHFVDEGTDTGPVIIQATVPVNDDDTEETLLEKIHAEEHKIYPEAVRLFCDGRLQVVGRKVITLPEA